MATSTPAAGYEDVPTKDLKPHPRNYRGHPDDQIDHIIQNFKDYDQYKNVVIANDGTILCGHGVVEAALKAERGSVTVKRMPFGPDDPRAIKLLALDNEVSRLAIIDDRSLVGLLEEIQKNSETGLLGTGYDDNAIKVLLQAAEPPEEFPEVDSDLETDYRCPKCGYEWSGQTTRRQDGDDSDGFE